MSPSGTAAKTLRVCGELLLARANRPPGTDWPGLKVVPNMAVGASDGVFTSAAGLPTYTITGIAIDKDNERAHGRDERLGVESFYKGNEFFYQYIRAIASH